MNEKKMDSQVIYSSNTNLMIGKRLKLYLGNKGFFYWNRYIYHGEECKINIVFVCFNKDDFKASPRVTAFSSATAPHSGH